MALPQYLSTTDPDVIAAIERNEAAHADFIERALAWAEERGFEIARTFRYNGLSARPRTEEITGLPGKPDESTFGEWTQVRNRTSSPKKANKAETEAMRAIRYVPELIPGLPASAQHGGFSYSSPVTFVVDGVAYAAYADTPSVWHQGELGDQWSEILGSTWAEARDARLAMGEIG